MQDKFKIGQLVKMKSDRMYVHNWQNPEKLATLPCAGIILEITTEDWIHPYFAFSKKYEDKLVQTQVAKVKWFDYKIPGLGSSDEFDLKEYNKTYSKLPVSYLVDFSNYMERLKKNKGLYK